MTNHEETYIKLQGGEPTFRQLLTSLPSRTLREALNVCQWLNKLAHGQAIANAYSAPTNSPDPTPSTYYLSILTTGVSHSKGQGWCPADLAGHHSRLLHRKGHKDVGKPCEAGPCSCKERGILILFFVLVILVPFSLCLLD
ncbi:hypothetical protein KEM48_013760 [Puccinia striiformis f. sp. tritici PST-130]|nr:hypothetical protein KEM48_013760 [Puccinia striiformis f. sp. tritici PST-130]